MTTLERLKPGVPKRALFFIAATVWGFAGVLLCARGWKQAMQAPLVLLFTLGVIFVIAFDHYIFSRIPRKHIQRITSIRHDAPCVFSFLDWRGYIMMATMITLGIVLRVSGVVSLRTLGTVYVFMGIFLLLSAFRFASAGILYEHGNTSA